MQTQITHKVDSHHTNPNYKCLLVNLLNEPTFHYIVKDGVLSKADLMPTDEFVLELCRLMATVSPTFRDELVRLAVEY